MSESGHKRDAGAFRRYAADYARDGVVIVRDALTADDLALVEQAFDYVLNDSDAFHERLYEKGEATILEAPGYYIDVPIFKEIMSRTPLAAIASGLFGEGPVWYVGDQLWMKRGGHAHRT